MRKLFITIGCLIALAIGCHAISTDAGGKKPTAKVSAEEIDKLIKQLGSNNAQTRAAATKALTDIGELALPALHKATKLPSLETRRRAEKTIIDIRGAAKIRRIARINEFGIDHFVERMIATRNSTETSDWDSLTDLVDSLAHDARTKGTLLGKLPNLGKLPLEVKDAYSEWLVGRQKLIAPKVRSKPSNSFVVCNEFSSRTEDCHESALIVNGSMQTSGAVSSSVVVCSESLGAADGAFSILVSGGNLEVVLLSDCMVICFGNMKVKSFAADCHITCFGDVSIGGANRCTIYATGKVTTVSPINSSNKVGRLLAARSPLINFFVPSFLGAEFKMEGERARLIRIAAGSVFEKSGLQLDDCLLAIDGAPTKSLAVLRSALRRSSLQDRTVLTIRRGARTIVFSAKLQV